LSNCFVVVGGESANFHPKEANDRPKENCFRQKWENSSLTTAKQDEKNSRLAPDGKRKRRIGFRLISILLKAAKSVMMLKALSATEDSLTGDPGLLRGACG